MNNIGIVATVVFQTKINDLIEVSRIISLKLFNCEDMFQGRKDFLTDEVPSVYTKDILGLRLILMQNPEEENLFQLNLLDRMPQQFLNLNEKESLNLSKRLLFLLSHCNEFTFL